MSGGLGKGLHVVQLLTKYVALFLYVSTEALAGPEHPCVSPVRGDQSLQLPILLSRKGAGMVTRWLQCLCPDLFGCCWRDGVDGLEALPICQRGLDLAADPSRNACVVQQAALRRSETFGSISICLLSFLGIALSRHGF